MIDNVGISVVREWIRSTTIGVRSETTGQFLPDNGEWLRCSEDCFYYCSERNNVVV